MLGALCLLLSLAAAETPDPAEIEVQLRRAKNEYAYGIYEQAIEHLHELIYPMRLTSDGQVVEARKYLALSYYLTGKINLANEEFGKLLYLSPDYQLDPYTIAPPIIEFLELVRTHMKPELDAIRQRKTDEKLRLPARQGFMRTVEQTYFERSDFATLMPFGAGQFQNGEYGLATVFALTELGLVAVNVAAYLWASSLGDYRPADRRLAEGLTITQYAAAGLFGVIWTVGVIQARLSFQPMVPGERVVREEPLPVQGMLRLRLVY
jgi:tetratricopeptide (TPR) repeat protein